MLFGHSKPAPNQILVRLGSSHPLGGLLLEHVKDVHRLGEGNRVRSSVGIPIKILNEFHDSPGDSFSKGPGPLGVVSVLGIEQRRAEDVLDLVGHRPEVLEARANEMEGSPLTGTHVQL